MNFIKMSRTVFLLMVAIWFVATPLSNASLQFNGSNSKAVLDGNYLDGTTHSSYTFEVWIKPFSLGGTLIGKAQYWKEWLLDNTPDGGLSLEVPGRILIGER